ncbi:hypothetical protein M422DRAFT_176927, partial [Sphaerobolus stellatus SS14]
MAFQQLPFDLQQEIISRIDKESDLLHLALTCRQLYAIIIPDHLECRTLTVDPTHISASFWIRLMGRKDIS